MALSCQTDVLALRLRPDFGDRAGVKPRGGEMTMSYFRAARAGEFATMDPTLARLIGRVPTPIPGVVRKGLG